MNKITLVLAVLLVLMVTGCQKAATATPAATADRALFGGEASVSATGKVVPVRWASLSMGASGVVKTVAVQEGQQVSAGQVLAQLDAPELEAAVAQSEAAVQAARAQLSRLQARPRPVDLRSAQAGAEAAKEAVTAAEVAAAVAKANVAVAEAAQGVAQAALAKLQAGPSAEDREIARIAVEQAKAQLLAAQGQRDSIGGTPGRLPGSYEGAQGTVAVSEFAITIADLNRQQVERGARREDIASAQAAVNQAGAALATAQVQEKAARQQVLIAKSQAQQAQAQVELLQSPARDEDITAARAQVTQAEAALKAAQAALDKTRLTAPFAGTVSEITMRVGEFVMPGMAVLALGDTKAWRVETTDLDEIDVARVVVGGPATITFDALPNTRLRCKVESIAPKAGTGGGGTTFKVVLALEESDPRLRWGMTAFADIRTE